MFSQMQLPLLLAQAGAQGASLDDSLSLPIKLLIAVGVLVGSFALGTLIARMLRLPDFAFRIGLVLCTLIAALTIVVLGWPPKRGIDLSGGVVLVYEVDQQQLHSSNLEDILRQINGRLKTNAQANSRGEIEIPLPPGMSEAAARKQLEGIRQELKFVERRTRGGRDVLVYETNRQEQDVNMDDMVAAISRRINPSGVKEVTVRQYGSAQLEIIVPEIEPREVDVIKRLISSSGALQFRIVANPNDHKHIINAARQSLAREVLNDKGEVIGRWVKMGREIGIPSAAIRDTESGGKEILMVIDEYNVGGQQLTSAAAGFDNAERAVHFTLSTEGGHFFYQLTSENLPDKSTNFYRHLGIILDGELLSAPVIQGAISTNGQISGSFSEDEVKSLVGILNAGSLPAALQKEPISEQRISSQLGEDTIQRGQYSMLVSTGLVVLFMLIYYRFAGVVANLAVLMNLILVVALMIVIQAAFTLPGLAGLVLTVGMAVDANVLIYERMREESARGASLRMAIRNGFSRAMSTIIDSNVTTMSTAAVLYVIGTDQIKGFAVTLFLGLVVSMYTAIYVSRLIFDIFERKQWITRLNMMQFVGATNFNFVRWRMPAIAMSTVLLVISMGAVYMRGTDLLDIDFTGGSSVHVLFDRSKPQSIAEVRRAVTDLPDVAVSAVGTDNLEYKIDTSEREIEKVQATMKRAFKDALRTYSLAYGDLKPVKPDQPATARATQEPASESATPSTRENEREKPAENRSDPNAPQRRDQPRKGASRPQPKTFEVALGGPSDAAFTALLLSQAEEADPARTTADKAAANASQTDAASGSDAPAASPPATRERPETSPPAGRAAEAQDDAARAPRRSSMPATRAAKASDIATRVELKFGEPISYVALSDRINERLTALKLPAVRFELTNPKYQEGSSSPFETWTLTIDLPPGETQRLLDSIKSELASTPVFPSANEIGGKVAGDAQLMAVYAILASLVVIVVYVWVRFQNMAFGLAAVIALVHDVLVAVGALALSAYLAPVLGFLLIDPFKISLAVVAALLTIVGFSINDTIVIFDRIRELRGKSPDVTEQMVNDAVNQTLSRTIITTGTVLTATTILYVFGGQGIHAFAYTMLIGLISGTYSTVFIAAPIVLWLVKPSTQTVRPRQAMSTPRPAKSA